jgi:hypothetical protein
MDCAAVWQCGSERQCGSVRQCVAVRTVVCVQYVRECAAVHLVVYGSVRGNVRLCRSAASVCGSARQQ